MSAKMSQKEYLKKYLSGGSDKKKKKKDKKSKSKSATVKIIDDDVHGGNNQEIDEELLLTGEDAPQIVGIIDASGSIEVENKWKSISGSVNEEITQMRQTDEDLWGKKATSYTADIHPMERKRKYDQSPPKKSKEYREPKRSDDQSPPRRRRNSDQSPSRRHSQDRTRKNSDQSPPRRRDATKSRRDSDSSPPRRTPVRQRKNSDQSPPRRTRWDSNQLPQRRGTDLDRSPPIRRSPSHPSHQPNVRQDFNGSSSRIKREKSADQSPPRRRNNSNPFRSNIKVEQPSPDSSPQRHRPRRSPDHSPPRIKQEHHSESPPPTHKNSGKMSKTLDGKRAGLQDAKTLKAETEERRRAEDRMFNNMSSEVSGRDAEVQVRQNSSYRRRRKEKEEDPEVQRKKAEHEQQKKELYSRWNKGLKQIEAYKARMTEEQYESSKPLARYSDDADLDEMLKQQERDDDPMLEYIRSKKKSQQKDANVPVMPKYKGSFPENRFGISPGYRWDGVDRSNGYEKKWFDVQSQKKAQAEEAYKYSTEDM